MKFLFLPVIIVYVAPYTDSVYSDEVPAAHYIRLFLVMEMLCLLERCSSFPCKQRL